MYILYCSIFNRYFSRAFPYDHNHNEAFFCRQTMVKKMLNREKTHINNFPDGIFDQEKWASTVDATSIFM